MRVTEKGQVTIPKELPRRVRASSPAQKLPSRGPMTPSSSAKSKVDRTGGETW